MRFSYSRIVLYVGFLYLLFPVSNWGSSRSQYFFYFFHLLLIFVILPRFISVLVHLSCVFPLFQIFAFSCPWSWSDVASCCVTLGPNNSSSVSPPQAQLTTVLARLLLFLVNLPTTCFPVRISLGANHSHTHLAKPAMGNSATIILLSSSLVSEISRFGSHFRHLISSNSNSALLLSSRVVCCFYLLFSCLCGGRRKCDIKYMLT